MNYTLLSFYGPSAISASKSQQLLSKIQSISPDVKQLHARFVHWVAMEQEPTEGQKIALTRLLDYAAESPYKGGEGAPAHLVVFPRLSTISPWSSQATALAENCNIPVERIERVIEYALDGGKSFTEKQLQAIAALLYDPLRESFSSNINAPKVLFEEAVAQPLAYIDIQSGGKEALQAANMEHGFALTPAEIDYLVDAFNNIGRNPTDAELMMFAQANSEHCRHKIFNAQFTIDEVVKEQSLFDMIRHTHKTNPQGTIVAYSDNSAVMEGGMITAWSPNYKADASATLKFAQTPFVGQEKHTHVVMKVETHNHPTAIAPYEGAGTGSGGEIRDESATGRGAKPKAGLMGLSVSNLCLPDGEEPWEVSPYGKPAHISSALDIMIQAPLGGAEYNNQFGRPALAGYFRTYEQYVAGKYRGYHKPIMIAGGLGSIGAEQVKKVIFPAGTLLIQLGGAGLPIGIGGGAASSADTKVAQDDQDPNAAAQPIYLDFNSVQRSNPEVQNRAQEVINICWSLGTDNPILAIHDVGAGGLSNAYPELVNDAKRGAIINLRDVPVEPVGMSPKEIWSNESQERFVVAIAPSSLALFDQVCQRERAPYAVIGQATEERQLVVNDSEPDAGTPVDMPMGVLLGATPKIKKADKRIAHAHTPINVNRVEVSYACEKVLRHPTVASKRFIITLGSRSAGGLTHRDQMVGPWQVPVADCAVTLADFDGFRGEAMSMGERTPLASINAPASGRIAIAEAITNLLAAPVELNRVKLSANWMAASGEPGEDAALYDTVRAVGMELCPQLGVSIPVGKDSLSMQTRWEDEQGVDKQVIAPVSLIVSAFATVKDVRQTWTPELKCLNEETSLMLIDLGRGQNRLGASILAQVINQVGNSVPDVDDPEQIIGLANALKQMREEDLVLAYHDRSDGGLWATVCEMAFASKTGVSLQLARTMDKVADEGKDWMLRTLFSEELGVVLQVKDAHIEKITRILEENDLATYSRVIAKPNSDNRIEVICAGEIAYKNSVEALHKIWDTVSYKITALRADPACAKLEHDIQGAAGVGLRWHLTFDPQEDVISKHLAAATKPKVALLRDQGIRPQIDMAWTLSQAGFDVFDVHMSDLQTGRASLTDFVGLVVAGGASYGDVLGAGRAWANTILFNDDMHKAFTAYFKRSDTFALGVGNGAQMLAALSVLIPGAQHWPLFTENTSKQFEARLCMVEIMDSPSIFFKNMAGTCLPIASTHGQGYANFDVKGDLNKVMGALRYCDGKGQATETYPFNPNGSPNGLTAMTTADGRFTIMMPHPEQVARNIQMSWTGGDASSLSPWMRMFYNARHWVG